ncbi:MAG: tRNA (adenosine(37)-N6)-dimethylallyltransferase MiaA [Clostridiales bacterium]|nr:tRNA (adenosine(37)-N6)-dimethylallyltransferase MiaA [Clostridiales bacterium]
MRTIIGITGTTSVGKSEVAVKLAKQLKSEIVSADSMQIYKDMDIGTAKIARSEMQGVPHHMLDIVEPNCNYSSFLYQRDASAIIDNMECLPIVVGGTGFYFDSLVYPPEFGNVEEARRTELQQILLNNGIETLQELLKKLDIDTYNQIDLNNTKRVIRAIEIAESGGKLAHGVRKINPKYNLVLFVLQREREELYKQIDKRVDKMLEKGLVAEVRALTEKYGFINTSAFSAIGYKEIIYYLTGSCTEEEAVAQIKINTRHYAKRQITYFKKMNVTEYISVDNKSSDEIAAHIYKQLASLKLI